MSATVPLPSRTVVPARDDHLALAFDAPANDGAADGGLKPEQPLLVSFEGLSTEEAERALRAFPGGRRVVLARP